MRSWATFSRIQSTFRLGASEAQPKAGFRKAPRDHRAALSTLDHRPSFFKVFQENRKDLGSEARRKIGVRSENTSRPSKRSFARGFETGISRGPRRVARHPDAPGRLQCSLRLVADAILRADPRDRHRHRRHASLWRVQPRLILAEFSPRACSRCPRHRGEAGWCDVTEPGACHGHSAQRERYPFTDGFREAPSLTPAVGAGRLAWDRHERR
jgi:hypothetical protein